MSASPPGSLYLGSALDPTSGKSTDEALHYDAKDFTTHGVIVGMTGSGKTGLGVILIEEALRSGVPVLALDPKGDLTNLLLNFPDFRPADFEPWINPGDAERAGQSRLDYAAGQAELWQKGLAGSGITPEQMRVVKDGSRMTVYTPGSTTGVPLNILGSLRRPALDWATDAESARDEIEGFVTSLLGLAGISADPITSREHILLSNLIEHAWSQGQDLDVARLLTQVQAPPMRKLGVFDLDTFYPAKERMALALRLNGLFAAPSFAAWMAGPPLDVGTMVARDGGRPHCSIVYLAHLSEEERHFILPLLLAKLVTWFRAQPGTTDLRALVYLDEAFGFVPPSANPPAKKPILTIFKQARAFGVGMVLSTQNPVDLDYKAISNAGTWMIGRLQTEQDKARLMDGLRAVSGEVDPAQLSNQISGLGKRQFLLQRAGKGAPLLFSTRWAMSYLRGPLTRDQIGALMRDAPEKQAAGAAPAPSPAAASTSAPASAPATATAPSTPTAAPAAGISPAVPFAPDLADNESPLAPTVAPGVPVLYVDPAAPWLAAVGGEAGGRRLQAALVARLYIGFDDTRADVDHREEWEAVYCPLGPRFDAAGGKEVDYDARDLRKNAPEGAIYVLPEAPVDKATFWKNAQQDIRDLLYRTERLEILRNPQLKLYSRPGESREQFAARCQAAAEDGSDAEVAKIRDKLEDRLDRLKDGLQAHEAKVAELQATAAAKKQEAWLGTAGSVLGSLLGGRSTSAKIASMARGMGTLTGRQSRASQADARVRAAKDKLADKEEDVAELEARIGQEVQEIHDRWMAIAADIETVEIPPEKTDIDVDEVVLAWVPVG